MVETKFLILILDEYLTIEYTVLWVKTYVFSIFNESEDFSSLKLFVPKFQNAQHVRTCII